jgi:hypothetical protein
MVEFVIVVVGRKARTRGELFVKYGNDPGQLPGRCSMTLSQT